MTLWVRFDRIWVTRSLTHDVNKKDKALLLYRIYTITLFFPLKTSGKCTKRMNVSCEITSFCQIIHFQDLQQQVLTRGHFEKLTPQGLNNLQTCYCGHNLLFFCQSSFKINCAYRPWDCAPKGCCQDCSLVTFISQTKIKYTFKGKKKSQSW